MKAVRQKRPFKKAHQVNFISTSYNYQGPLDEDGRNEEIQLGDGNKQKTNETQGKTSNAADQEGNI